MRKEVTMKIETITVPAFQANWDAVWTDGISPTSCQIALQGTLKVEDVKVDKYMYTGGAGRACIWDGIYLKGVGRTPLVNDARPDYATGKNSMTEGIIEILNLVAVHRWFPESVRPLGIFLGEEQCRPNLEGQNVDSHPEHMLVDDSSLVARTIPYRVAHFFQSSLTSDELYLELKRYNPQLNETNKTTFYVEYAKMVANKLAFLFINRFSIGGTHIGNFGVNGLPFDLAAATFLGDFRNCYTTAQNVPIWEESYMALQQIMDALLSLNVDKGYAPNELYCFIFDELPDVWATALRYNACRMVGLDDTQMSKLDPIKLAALGDEIVEYLAKDTASFLPCDVYTAYYEFPPTLGNDFKTELPALLEGGFTASQGLNAAWSNLGFLPTFDTKARCKKICSDRTGLIHEIGVVFDCRQARKDNGRVSRDQYQQILSKFLAIINKEL